jgi:hypothetical protein
MKKHSNKLAALALLVSASVAAPMAVAQQAPAGSPCAPKRQRSANPCGPANPCAPRKKKGQVEGETPSNPCAPKKGLQGDTPGNPCAPKKKMMGDAAKEKDAPKDAEKK